MTAPALPLIAGGDLDRAFAWRTDGPRRVRDFLADAATLAAALPPGGAILNVCEDRYHFAVGFAAGLLAGRISLQPASQSAETLRRLADDFPDAHCLADGDFAAGDLPRIAWPTLSGDPARRIAAVPEIPADQVAAILFTSGSTGLPQAQVKTWGKLVANGRAEAVALGLDRQPHVLVGTVPVQHSYGFESTFLLALQGGCPFWSGKPFYPQDIVDALAAVPRPRLLVTTPFHLNALLAAELELPAVDLWLSATAPLAGELAAAAEARSGTPLLEIYGSTESGQLATRRTTASAAWQPLPGVRLEQDASTTWASGAHVEGRVALGDRLELRPDGSFLLLGRHADLINIAGKRTSLAYLDHQIQAIPGVVDAAFFLPDASGPDGIARLTAFVVAPQADRRALLAALRERIDPIFLPRPLVLVEALPRNPTGKLPRSSLLALYAEKVARHG